MFQTEREVANRATGGASPAAMTGAALVDAGAQTAVKAVSEAVHVARNEKLAGAAVSTLPAPLWRGAGKVSAPHLTCRVTNDRAQPEAGQRIAQPHTDPTTPVIDLVSPLSD